MKFRILYFSLLFSFVYGLNLRSIELIENWENLQNGNITIDWTEYDGFPISRAETILNHPMDEIAALIQDLDNYPKVFKRVTKTRQLEPDVAQIVLDMPFPFDGRDYIIKYTIESTDNNWFFIFSSVKYPDGHLDPNHVRLPNAAGIWILTKLGVNKTKITYAWNGELLGNFPDFGLEKAWITQGTEELNWLNETLLNKDNS